jgi:hypothetical protein
MVMNQLNRVQYSYVNVEVVVGKPYFEKSVTYSDAEEEWENVPDRARCCEGHEEQPRA